MNPALGNSFWTIQEMRTCWKVNGIFYQLTEKGDSVMGVVDAAGWLFYAME